MRVLLSDPCSTTIELEASAILWAVQKCDHYLRGMPSFKVVTDHPPLVGIFDKPLAALANDGLQRIRERLVMYNFTAIWRAGKAHLIADALSRAPYFPLDESSEIKICGVVLCCDICISRLDSYWKHARMIR